MAMSKEEIEEKADVEVGSDECLVISCTSCKLNGNQIPCVGYCLICEDYLCNSCFRRHRWPQATRNHILLEKSQMPAKRIAKRKDSFDEICEEHKDSMVSYFCKSCRLIGCANCMRDLHSSCSGVTYIPDHIKSEKLEIRNIYYDFSLRSPIEQLQGVKEKIPRYKFAIEKYGSDAKQQVKQFCRVMQEALDDLESEMEDKIDNIGKEDTTMLDLLSKKCDFIKEKFKKLLFKVKNNNSDEKKCKLFVSSHQAREEEELFEKDKVIEQLQQLLMVTKIKFKPEFGIGVNGKLQLGDIVEIREKVKREIVWKELGTINTLSEAEIEANKEPKSYLSCSIKACIVLQNGKLLVADSQNKTARLCSTSLHGENYKDISNVLDMVKLEGEPADLTQVVHDLVAVTLPEAKKVQFLEVGHDTLNIGDCIEVRGECHGIGSLDKMLMVGYKKPPMVEIMDLSGSVLKVIKGDKETGFIFSFPRSVACDSVRKLVYIADFDANAVVAMDLVGDIRAIFRENGMVNPLAVTMGIGGSLLVAVKWPFSVQRISADFTTRDELRVREDTWHIQCLAFSSVVNQLFYACYGYPINVRKI